MSTHEPQYVPQLRMMRPSLRDLPPLDPPAGYVLRHFRPGDEAGLTKTLKAAFDESSMDAKWAIINNNGFMPQRSWLMEHDGQIVSSASMLYDPDPPAARQTGTAFLHWVAARPGHAGKRLGYWTCLAVLHRMAGEGYRRAGLGTDIGRFPAIKTYLNLGFEPRLVDASQPDVWRGTFNGLGHPELAERFAEQLAEAPHEF